MFHPTAGRARDLAEKAVGHLRCAKPPIRPITGGDTSCDHLRTRSWRRGAEIKIQEEEFNRTCAVDCSPVQACALPALSRPITVPENATRPLDGKESVFYEDEADDGHGWDEDDYNEDDAYWFDEGAAHSQGRSRQ